MSVCPTVFVRVLSFLKEEGREIWCWINESDFDHKLHEKIDNDGNPVAVAPVEAPAPVVEQPAPVVEAPPAPSVVEQPAPVVEAPPAPSVVEVVAPPAPPVI